jgi:hypothetical protein
MFLTVNGYSLLSSILQCKEANDEELFEEQVGTSLCGFACSDMCDVFCSTSTGG